MTSAVRSYYYTIPRLVETRTLILSCSTLPPGLRDTTAGTGQHALRDRELALFILHVLELVLCSGFGSGV